MKPMSAARSSSGTAAAIHQRARDTAGAGTAATCTSGVTAHLPGPEEAHPPELGKLALVRVEHEVARIPERRIQDRALALTEHDRVCDFRCPCRARAARVEEHSVQVEAVDQVELGDVHEV